MFRRILIAVLLAATAAAAQSAPRDELAQVEAEQKAREQERADALGEADQTRREMAELTAQLEELNRVHAAGQTEVSDRRLKLAALNARERALAARAGADRSRLAHLLGALQMFSRNRPPALLLHAADARDAVRAAILIRSMTPDLERQVRGLAAQEQAAQAARRDAAAGEGDLLSAESSLADNAASIEATLVRKQALTEALSAQAAGADAAIAELSARAGALRAVVGRLPPAPAAKALNGPRAGSLRDPVTGQLILRFGAPDRAGKASLGWDWRAAGGAEVVAPGAALVDYAGPVEGWGEVAILNLGDDVRVVLAGLDLITARAGQSVAPGQIIGRMAQKPRGGVNSGPILHLEVRKNGQTVDPASFMARR